MTTARQLPKTRSRGEKQANHDYLSSITANIQPKVGESRKMSEYSNGGTGNQN